MLNFQNPEMTQILTLTYGDINNILQGLGVGPGSATKRWPLLENDLFFWGEKKLPKKIFFFCIYLLVMPKYWVKNYFAHGRFPEVGQKQKTEKKRERKRERKTERW